MATEGPLAEPPPVIAGPSPDELSTTLAQVSITSAAAPRPSGTGTTVRVVVPHEIKPRLVSSPFKAAGEPRTLRRDSMERREALLKGLEGSRQRRRWENAHLLSNPWAVPPLPSDWEVRPTYPRRTVPYYLAPLWDAAEFQRAVESKLQGRRGSTRSRGHRVGHGAGITPMEDPAAAIPKEVRAKLKRAKAARGLLQDLEETVRAFVQKWNDREARLRGDGLQDVPLTSDSEEDEEIVFVGRNGVMHEAPGRKLPPLDQDQAQDEARDQEHRPVDTISREKMVFEGLDDDKGAAFARWLVHCVGSYYGLRTWSVTRDVAGEAKRREAYVGLDKRARGFMGRAVEVGREIELPRPLWGMV